MKNTFLYIRYSTDAQSHGSSYDRQLGLAKAYCPTLIEDKSHIFYDSGKSAFSGANTADGGELKRFIDDVKGGAVPKGSTLLVEDLDRLSRADMWDASDQFRDLLSRGIIIVTTRDGRNYKDSLPIADALTTLIKQDLANKESAGKSFRVGQSYVNRYAQARSGLKVKVLLPSWLEWAGPNTDYRIKEAEAGTVKHIFKMAAEGHSYAVIAKDLNRKGVEPFRSRGKGKLWITASLLAIVKGHAAIGTYAPRDGGEPIEGYFPSIVDRAMFDAAQGARAERKRDKVTVSAARINVWGKVGVCGLCRRSMFCLPKGRGGQLYLVCSGKMGGECDAKNVRADRSELAFREVLLNAVHADYFTADKRDDEMELRQLEGRIDGVRQRKAKLVEMLENDPMPEIVVAIKKANAEIRTLEDAQAGVQQRAARDTSVERSRAALMSKIDLEGKEARMEANALLRRLAITTEIVRHDEQINYIVKQAGKKVLAVYDKDGGIIATSYSQQTAERMYDRGEIAELEYNVSLDDVLGRTARKRKAA